MCSETCPRHPCNFADFHQQCTRCLTATVNVCQHVAVLCRCDEHFTLTGFNVKLWMFKHQQKDEERMRMLMILKHTSMWLLQYLLVTSFHIPKHLQLSLIVGFFVYNRFYHEKPTHHQKPSKVLANKTAVDTADLANKPREEVETNLTFAGFIAFKCTLAFEVKSGGPPLVINGLSPLYKWPYTWVTRAITTINGVIILLIIGFWAHLAGKVHMVGLFLLFRGMDICALKYEQPYRYPDLSKLVILRTRPLLKGIKPFRWRVQWSLGR